MSFNIELREPFIVSSNSEDVKNENEDESESYDSEEEEIVKQILLQQPRPSITSPIQSSAQITRPQHEYDWQVN
jgi:hypothetical protein